MLRCLVSAVRVCFSFLALYAMNRKAGYFLMLSLIMLIMRMVGYKSYKQATACQSEKKPTETFNPNSIPMLAINCAK